MPPSPGAAPLLRPLCPGLQLPSGAAGDGDLDTPDPGISAFWSSGVSRGACTPSAALPGAGTRLCQARRSQSLTLASRQVGANGRPVSYGKIYNNKHGVWFSFVL